CFHCFAPKPRGKSRWTKLPSPCSMGNARFAPKMPLRKAQKNKRTNHTMSFEWFVAKRYLRSPNRPTVLRLVTAFSVLGVAAHISLTRPGTGGIPNYQALAEQLGKIEGVRSVTPAIYQTVLLSFGGEARGMVTKGIDVALEEKSDEALQKLAAGRLDFTSDGEGIDGLLVGK